MSNFAINSVVLVGRLTRKAELRSLASGSAVCSLRIACNSVRRDSEGDYHEKPNYFDVDVFGSEAESVAKYTRKGSRVGIDGRLEWREWETTNKQKREAVSVVADMVMFLDGPGDGQPEEHSDEDEDGERWSDVDDELAGVGGGVPSGRSGWLF